MVGGGGVGGGACGSSNAGTGGAGGGVIDTYTTMSAGIIKNTQYNFTIWISIQNYIISNNNTKRHIKSYISPKSIKSSNTINYSSF